MLVLVHHGETVSPHVDPMRPLSTPGREAAARLARTVAAKGVRPSAIWHSGKLRARQTAELFREACNPLATFEAVRGLLPDDPPEWIRDRLAADHRAVLIVGHMPHLPRLLHLLTGGRVPGVREFPLHGAVALEREGEEWKESWRQE